MTRTHNTNPSPSQLRCLRLLADGLSRKEICKRLGMSDGTVDGHLRILYERLDVDNAAQAVAVGIRRGLIE